MGICRTCRMTQMSWIDFEFYTEDEFIREYGSRCHHCGTRDWRKQHSCPSNTCRAR